MSHSQNTSPSFPEKTSKPSHKKPNTNWHEAVVCALQIDLRDYSHLLEFLTEYPLGKKGFRIDLLLIKKLSDQSISKTVAQIFKTFNLFEIKGLGSSMNTDCYYKTIGYACFLIDQSGKACQYTHTDISLSFLCLHYPGKLIKYLTKKRKLEVEKSAPGVYHISKEIFPAQVIVTPELSPDDSLYLHCLTSHLRDAQLVQKLVNDYRLHQKEEIYTRYLHQLSNASIKSKGESTMVCEGLLNLCGTSSAEIIERTKKADAAFYQPRIDALTAKNEQQASFISELSSQVDYLKNLLTQHNIPFSPDA